MPENTDADFHVRPYVHEVAGTKALHFTIAEIQSRMQTGRPDALDLEYTRRMMAALLFKPQPERLLMIGLGGGSLAKFCYRHLPDAQIKVLEINPHVIALRDEFCVPPDDARFTVRCGDGAELVRQTRHAPDLLMVDGFDNEGQPPALCSQRFYDDCHDALQPEGLLVVNLYAGHPQHELFLARLRRSFDDQVLAVSDADCSNTIVFAFKGRLPGRLRPATHARKPASFDVQTWDELKPAFAAVASALQRRIEADPLDDAH